MRQPDEGGVIWINVEGLHDVDALGGLAHGGSHSRQDRRSAIGARQFPDPVR